MAIEWSKVVTSFGHVTFDITNTWKYHVSFYTVILKKNDTSGFNAIPGATGQRRDFLGVLNPSVTPEPGLNIGEPPVIIYLLKPF